MSLITIIGAGMMGSAMSLPATDNGHKVRIVGTHLDREIVDYAKANHYHIKMKRALPESIEYYQIEDVDKAIEGSDLIICGVSSYGVDWFCDEILPRIPVTMPILSVTKGMVDLPDGQLQSFPAYIKQKTACAHALNAVGGPCTSYELADRNHSAVAFCGYDMSILKQIKKLMTTNYYHVSLSTDVEGVECAVAMKNAYALGVSLAVGMGADKYNPQAALFGQCVREMTRLLELIGASRDNIVYGAGDLYVTIYGGRTRLLGSLLGQGKSFDQAMQELSGVTLESVSIARRTVKAVRILAGRGVVKEEEFPLLMHIGARLEGSLAEIPWASFEKITE